MPTLTALRPLNGTYGHVHPGGVFTCDDLTAESLESRGLAVQYRQSVQPVYDAASFIPKAYETKVITAAAPEIAVPIPVTTEPRRRR